MKFEPNALARYDVEHVLGRGGMGTVYCVRERATGRKLALKRIGRTCTARQASAFEREYRALASLQHAQIVQVFEYGVDADGPYYTMELLEGGDLASRAPMPWQQVCVCLRDAACVLGVLHARRLVHRDLSPRNLWLTPDGRLKLLDFGALTAFGPAPEIVGTPAFVAPEALQGRALDQRTDLYALGALGYWLLTGTHAYRATELHDLATAWTQAPLPASQAARRPDASQPGIPAALDRLLDSLLRPDPNARPSLTADVVDELNALAGLGSEAHDIAVSGYLDSGAFVGRDAERDRYALHLEDAARGRPQALVIEGPRGSGRSRLLFELVLDARLRGANVAHVSCTAGAHPYALASELLAALLRVAPGEALAAARPHAAVLGALCPPLAEALAPAPQTTLSDPLQARLQRQSALLDFCRRLARRHCLVIALDDLQLADAESLALLLSLARCADGERLLLVGTTSLPRTRASVTSLESLRAVCRVLSVPPLSAADAHALLRSVFGEVAYLERCAARVHQLAAGNPASIMALVRQLVRCGAVRYQDGAWTLPAELPENLPTTTRAQLTAELASLPALARNLLRVLSVVEHDTFPRALLEPLLDAAGAAIAEALALLADLRCVRVSQAGLSLAQPELRALLRAELPPGLAVRAHAALARELARAPDVLSQARAGLHELLGGEDAAARTRLLALCRRLMGGEHELLAAAAPVLEAVLQQLPAAETHDPDAAHTALLCVLAVAGYQVDRRYAARYADRALAVLERRLCFPVARRLSHRLGVRAALMVALGASALSLRLRRAELGLTELITWLVAITGYLMGPATLYLDSVRLRGYARVLEPLLGLGADHGVACVHRFCLGLVAATEDRLGEAHDLQLQVVERLKRAGPVPGMTDKNRRNLLGAALYNVSIRYSWACDARALSVADELAGMSPLHAIQAEHVRALYFLHRGQPRRAAECDARMERQAILLGTAWQAELLVPRHQLRLSSWTLDSAQLKRAAQGLERLARAHPSFERGARRARAAHFILRGQPARALPLLEADEPAARAGRPVLMRALLATAYNQLGRHADAAELCQHELSQLTARDRAFLIVHLPIEGELALAEAGLGALRAAQTRLDTLLRMHAAAGPLVVGYLHALRARVALQAGDAPQAEAHWQALEQCHRPLGYLGLIDQCEALRAALEDLRSRPSGRHLATPSLRPANDTTQATVAESGEVVTTPRAALALALEISGADRAFALAGAAARPAAWVGAEPAEVALRWAQARLSAATEPLDEHTLELDVTDTADDPTIFGHESVVYRGVSLWSSGAAASAVAMLVLGSNTQMPKIPPSDVLRLLADLLVREASSPAEALSSSR